MTIEAFSDRETIFQQDWWLSAAAGDSIETVEVNWDGMIVGSLSFVRERRFGLRRLRMPRYARTLGPIFRLPPAKPVQHRQSVIRITAELLRKLPSHDSLHTVLHPGSQAGLALSLAGCDLTFLPTFRVEATQPSSSLMSACDQKTRNILRKAQRTMQVTRHADVERFQALSERDRFGTRNYHDFQMLGRIFAACNERGQGIILAASDAEGRDRGAAMLIWGSEALYFWTTARDGSTVDNSVNAFLVWEALQLAQELGIAFDSDGSSSPEAARFMSRFGFPEVARLSAMRSRWSYRVLQAIAAPSSQRRQG